MTNVSGHCDNGVITGVISFHEFLDGVLSDVAHVFTDTVDWLAHEMVTVSCVMDALKCRVALVGVALGRKSSDELPLSLDLGSLELRVAQNVT